MSATITIHATKREQSGKGYARSLRRADKIPAVVYGHGYEPVSITVDGILLNKMFKPGCEADAEYQLFDLKIEGAAARAGKKVMIREIQRHPLQQYIEHIDFFAVKMDEPVVAPVHIRLHGKPEGVKLGGILRHILREIEIKGLPADIPSHVDLDIEHMQVGDSIHVSDLQLPENVQLLTDPAAAVVNIMAPAAVKEGAEGEAPAAASGEPAPAAT
ncbi:MAG: 50S ribosomal protein L25/general stress protein Ctc [Deltaproteobacteria bacterium]|nr:50S ribosomal protein L25/general stress protein Ctc [Deltaproteobacteria bacterium]